MSVNIYDATDGKLKPFVGGTFYAECPIASILPYGGSEPPDGWLLCQGQEVAKIRYQDLYNVIGDSFGTASDNTKFVLPDLRESVLVGSGTRSSGVSAHDTYTVGQFKDDQMQNAQGAFCAYSYATGAGSGVFSSITDNPNLLADGSANAYNYDVFQFNLSNVARTGTTTHGKQLGVNFIIKALKTALPADFESQIEDLVDTALEPVTDVIPSTASSSNKLATMADRTKCISDTDWNTIETII